MLQGFRKRLGNDYNGRKSTLANYIKRNTDPQAFPSVKIQEIGGKKVVMIEVEESQEKPVFFKNHAYKRVGKNIQKLLKSVKKRR